MTATTPTRHYPYPLPADPFDVPGDMQALAEAVDDDVQANLANVIKPRKYVKLRGTSAMSIVTNIETDIVYETETTDTDNMADLSSLPTAVTIRTAGLYVVTLGAAPRNGSWGQVILRIKQNGVSISELSVTSKPATIENFASFGALIPCVVGDRITTTVTQDGASSMLLDARDLIVFRTAT
jgi:hypothetical protein